MLTHASRVTSPNSPRPNTRLATRDSGLLRRGWADGVCLLALLGFALAVVAPVLAGGVPVGTDTLKLWDPNAPERSDPSHLIVNNQILADSALQNLPWQVVVRRSIAEGEWPLWVPDIYAGYPLQADSQGQLYYPVNWLLWLLPLPTALQVNAVLHLWLAGAGMYVLARLLGVSRGGSLLAVLVRASRGDSYSGGSLYIAGRPQPGDLAFVARGPLPAKLQLTYEG
jgi:hypothetical protein